MHTVTRRMDRQLPYFELLQRAISARYTIYLRALYVPIAESERVQHLYVFHIYIFF